MGTELYICQLLYSYLYPFILFMMQYLVITQLLLVFSGSVIGDGCCRSKVVEGSTYTLQGEEDTSSFSCVDRCTYTKEGEANSKYCFADGDLQVECKDSTGGVADTTPSGGGAEAATTASSSETTTASGCKCGVKRTSRIVGGTETEVNEYPWMAAIATTSESFFCGGTLISSQWVLTAAHCMFKDNAGTQAQTAGEIRIVLGEHDIGSQLESQIPRKVVQVSQIINHPSYDASSSNNDIALIKLSEEVDLNVYTPACLPNTADNYEGQKAWVYGWGTTSFGGSTSDKLLEVEVPVISNTVCSSAMSAGITDAMLCAGGELNKDGCQGDSGGPLTVDVNNQHVLIGDVSFGNGCGLAGQYGVYGDVAYFRSWIDTTVSGAKYCPA